MTEYEKEVLKHAPNSFSAARIRLRLAIHDLLMAFSDAFKEWAKKYE